MVKQKHTVEAGDYLISPLAACEDQKRPGFPGMFTAPFEGWGMICFSSQETGGRGSEVRGAHREMRFRRDHRHYD
jgi:hypothetical protein